MAKKWLETYTGANLVKGYAKWFGVDRICALKELQMLGVVFSEEEIRKEKEKEQQRMETIRKRKALREEKLRGSQEAINYWCDFYWWQGGQIEEGAVSDSELDELPF